MPPIPLPMTTPVRSGEGNFPSRPAWVTAWCAAARANCAKRSYRRASLRSMYCRGSKPLTSQAKRTDSLCGSNLVIGAAPGVPARSAVQVVSTSVPTGVADGAELFRILVRNVDIELLLERHHELHRVQAVGAEVFHEAGLARELFP